MVEIKKKCLICGKTTSLKITNKVAEMYDKYLAGYGLIQDLPLPADKREFLMSGMCMSCQEDFFNSEEEE